MGPPKVLDTDQVERCRCVCWGGVVGVGVRDITDNAQMSPGREQAILLIDVPRPFGLPKEQKQQMVQ